MAIFARQNRSLGISTKRQKYDLPLNKDKGGRFLSILMGLMTFLMMLTLSASFVLSAMNERWSKGLENKATVEISAEDASGVALNQEDIDAQTIAAQDFLASHPAVEESVVMDKADIIQLVAPWLGDNVGLENVPLPGIISVKFKDEMLYSLEDIEIALTEDVPQARLDNHESWLNDVLSFTGAIKMAAVLMTLIITITTIVAVGGAIQSRMAVYREELELLHLMGASDGYISRQLQRYAFLTILKGAAIGMVLGWLLIFIIGLIAGKMEVSLLPEFSLSFNQVCFLILLPVIIAIIGMSTARQTVLRFLRQMP
ncbi:MAG: FtsX-like permease family protein [Pseudomonadota bacterium]